MLTRRAFMMSGAVLGGGLVLGYFFTPRRLAVRGASVSAIHYLATWVGIGVDNTVTVLVPHAEMGQGVHTALPMMLAEELDADWSLVRVAQAPATGEYAVGDLVRGFLMGNSVPEIFERQAEYASYRIAALKRLQITGGSASVRFTGRWGMRRAGAAARSMLIDAAAARWSVPASECVARLSHVYHEASGRQATFGELVEDAARQTLPDEPRLKRRGSYVISGRPLPRLDIPPMVTGKQAYGIDVRVPGMRYAAIRHAPVFGARIASFDAKSVHGILDGSQIVKLPGAVAVVGESFWSASRAVNQLAIEFDDGAHARLNSDQIREEMRRALDDGKPEYDRDLGEDIATPDRASGVREAVYEVPFLAHATLEPVNCTAWYHDGQLEIWAGTQDLLGTRDVAARTAGIDLERVTMHPVAIGGGFGRRVPGSFNYVEDAVRIAMQVQGPVQLIWNRGEDLQHDFYRPAVFSRFRAVTGPTGGVDMWRNEYTDIGLNDNVSAAFIPYAIANQRIGRVLHSTPVPLGYWRSVEHSYQGFFTESFVDELAHATGADPLEFRLNLLHEAPRHAAVLRRAAQLLNWNLKASPGHGKGIAVHECFGSIVAQAAEVSIDADGALRVHRVAAVVDAGEIVNPDIARAQIEGGILFGLGAALYGSITILEGRVQQDNFSGYPVAMFADTPDIQVDFIESGADLGGMGEVGVPAVAPAVCNALHAATGVRVRRLPIAGQTLG